MDITSKIFRVYDVRGVYKEDIDEDVFYTLGKTFATYIKEGPMVVGRDIRLSSSSLAESFIRGILDCGLDVLDIGEVTTPMLYFAVTHLGGSGGAMITASHNPEEYNGIKFTDKNSQPIGGKQIGEFFKTVKTKEVDKKGEKKNVDVSEDYLTIITKDFKISRKIKINIEAKNSVAEKYLKRFLQKLGPEVEFSSSLADLNVAFDLDGDRLMVFDDSSIKFSGDVVGGVIADSFLKKGETLVSDIVSTRALEDYFSGRGIIVCRSAVGYFFIPKSMVDSGAVLGAEFSGHYYFKSLNYNESAFFALRKLLEALDKNPGLSILDLARPFMKYANSGQINLPIVSKGGWPEILSQLQEKYKSGKQNLVDGLLVEYEDPANGGVNWWFSARPSNTEPLVRLVIEAKNETLLEEKKKEILNLFKG